MKQTITQKNLDSLLICIPRDCNQHIATREDGVKLYVVDLTNRKDCPRGHKYALEFDDSEGRRYTAFSRMDKESFIEALFDYLNKYELLIKE